MFQFRRFPTYAYLIQRRLLEYCSSGFPHSVISGSKPICGSPKLIAACHVLHRLLMPRHSPCALISLTSWLRFSRIWPSPNQFGSLNKNHAGFRDFWLHCFYPFTRTASAVLIKVSTISASTLLLALPSGIIIHIVQFSRCAFQPLLRSDFSTQLPLDTEIQAYLVVGQSGLEPPTSRLSVVCSSQLSYWPVWWRLAGSNR